MTSTLPTIIISVQLWTIAVMAVAGSGWKPIPPPPGLYLSKTAPFPVRNVDAEHSPAHEIRFDPLSSEPEAVVRQEDFIKHQKYDIFGPADDVIYTKDTIKPFKAIPIYEGGRKRPSSISYSSFNPFPGKKPLKPVFFDKPDFIKVGPYKDVVKYVKPFKAAYPNAFSDNEITPFHPHPPGHGDRCPLYKVSFRQDLYFQYIQYKVHMPDLKEFTICMWSKFHNHSFDHPLFSYAVRHQPKAIYMWVSNTERSNYYNMKINGHPIFRLNYPIRLNRWYHTCQSWNSKTGEWQVWVNNLRIGRGFHNLLVGHTIPGGGIAISGQEQLQYGGGFLEASDIPKGGSGGLLGEITLVQLYRIALTAGKAYTDHRHHHSVFTSTTPEPPEIPTEEPPPTPEHPFLENGQLKKPLKVFELAESLRTKGNLDTPQNQPTFTDFFDGHPYLGHHPSALNLIPYAEHNIFKRNEDATASVQSVPAPGKVKFVTSPAVGVHVEKIKFSANADANGAEPEELLQWSETGRRSRRSANETILEEYINDEEDYIQSGEDERTGRGLSPRRRRPPRHSYTSKRFVPGRKKTVRHYSNPEKVFAKKQVILGEVHFRPVVAHEFAYAAGIPILTGLKPQQPKDEEKEPDDNPLHASGSDVIGPPQPEPAEDEVHRIMHVCSGCDSDPYRKVAVISWRSTPKKLFSGALFLRARPECGKF